MSDINLPVAETVAKTRRQALRRSFRGMLRPAAHLITLVAIVYLFYVTAVGFIAMVRTQAVVWQNRIDAFQKECVFRSEAVVYCTKGSFPTPIRCTCTTGRIVITVLTE